MVLVRCLFVRFCFSMHTKGLFTFPATSSSQSRLLDLLGPSSHKELSVGTQVGTSLDFSLSFLLYPRRRSYRSKSLTKAGLPGLIRLPLCTHRIFPLVFSVPTHIHAAYQLKALPRNIKKHIFRMKNVEPMPPLYEHEEGMQKTYAPGGVGAA